MAYRFSRSPASSVATPEQTPLQKTIEAYLRNLYAFGPDVQLTVSAPKEKVITSNLARSLE